MCFQNSSCKKVFVAEAVSWDEDRIEIGLPGFLEYSKSVEGSMRVGHFWCDGEWGNQW